MLELRDVTKKFGDFAALDGVSFTINPGEIVGLLGENGAGKSTLMNIVGGLFAPTAGELLWDGKPLHLPSPRAATAQGIGVVHQHFMLVPVFTVAENVALHAAAPGALYRAGEWEQRVESWADSLGWRIDASRRVETLSVGERQRVEILKALFSRATEGEERTTRLLLLDEPTANLVPAEVEELTMVLHRLREGGCGIVFVSHKLNEVLALCDRTVVLRHGKVVGQTARDTTTRELASMMVGRDYQPDAPRERSVPPPNSSRFTIRGLQCGQLRDFSLEVAGGEIVGLAGVDGNGQGELMDALLGLREHQAEAMDVRQGDAELPGQLGAIPADRQHVGLILSFDLAENLALHPALRKQMRGKFGTLQWKPIRLRARELLERFDVRMPAGKERSLAAQLSGGNQQKVVIARALSFDPNTVIAADPTRGLDIGATQFVHAQLRKAAAEGAPVLLISSDLDEVLQLSDRVGVLYEGKLLPGPELLAAPVDRDVVGALMGGDSHTGLIKNPAGEPTAKRPLDAALGESAL